MSIQLSIIHSEVTVDEDGSAQCPLCEEKLHEENEWRDHVEMERMRLMNTIVAIKNSAVRR